MKKMSETSRIPISLHIGSVWALYFAPTIFLIILFCERDILLDVCPQAREQQCRQGRANVQYRVFRMWGGRNFFSLYIIPPVLASFTRICLMWAFQLRLLSRVRPRKLNESSCSISIPQIFKFMLSLYSEIFFCLVENIMNLDLPAFIDSLFTHSQL